MTYHLKKMTVPPEVVVLRGVVADLLAAHEELETNVETADDDELESLALRIDAQLRRARLALHRLDQALKDFDQLDRLLE